MAKVTIKQRMAKITIKQWLYSFMRNYHKKEDFKTDLNQMIEVLKGDKSTPNQLAFYKRVRNKLTKIEARLEELRVEIKAERISMGEIIELQSLAKFIDSDDVELLQWAGVEENVK
jgi:hypothetical protein